MDLMQSIFGDPETDAGKTAAELAKIYWRTSTLEKVVDRFLPDSEEEDLATQERLLSIAMKKRALGLPMTSDAYELASNEQIPFTTRMTGLAGRELIQKIPDPSLLEPLSGKLPWMRPAPIAERGVLNALTGIGGKYARSIRSFIR